MGDLPPLPDEIWADPGRRDWYFREKKPDSVARYVRDTRIAALEDDLAKEKAENARLKAVISACHWYWPSDDTSSENCCGHPFEVVENHGEGEVIELSRGGVVETMYCAYLRPAVDSDSDDEFWVHEATVEAAEAKLQAEVKRRAALS